MTINIAQAGLRDVFKHKEHHRKLLEREEIAISENFVFYLPAKNSGTDVAVVMHKSLRSSLEFLISPSVRANAKVLSSNEFIFAPLYSERHCSGWHDISRSCEKAGYVINATSTRHFIATIMGQSDLSNRDIETLQKHMGHSKEIHEIVYRCPESTKSILIADQISKKIQPLFRKKKQMENSSKQTLLAKNLQKALLMRNLR